MYENLIAVCYPAGSRGEAIARIIELSPSVYRRNPDRMAEPDQVGRMNKTVTRFGWLTDFDVQPLFGMIEYMNQRGIYFKFDHTLAHDIIEDWQRIVPQLLFAKDQNHRYRLHEIMCRHKIVVSDHVHSVHMRQLLPGCKTVAVCGDSRLAIDLLYQNGWLCRPHLGPHTNPTFMPQPISTAKLPMDAI